VRHATFLAIDEALASSITIPLEMLHAADVITRTQEKYLAALNNLLG